MDPTLAVGAFRNEVAMSLASIVREMIIMQTQLINTQIKEQLQAAGRGPLSASQQMLALQESWQKITSWNDTHQRDFMKRMTNQFLSLAKLCEDTYLCFGRTRFEHIPTAAAYTVLTDIPKTQVIVYELMRTASHESVVTSGRFESESMVAQMMIVQTIMRLTFNQLVSLSNMQMVPNADIAKVAPVALAATAEPVEVANDEVKQSESRPSEIKPVEIKPAETPKSTETKSAETKSAETKPAETKPAETKPAETEAVVTETPKPADKPAANADATTKTDTKAAETKTEEAKPEAAKSEPASAVTASAVTVTAVPASAVTAEASSKVPTGVALTELPHTHALPPPSPAALADKSQIFDGSSREGDAGLHLPDDAKANYKTEVEKVMEGLIKVITPEVKQKDVLPSDSITDKIARMQPASAQANVPTVGTKSETSLAGLTDLHLSQLTTPTTTSITKL